MAVGAHCAPSHTSFNSSCLWVAPHSPPPASLSLAHLARWPRRCWKWLLRCSRTGLLDIQRGRHPPVGHFQSEGDTALRKRRTERLIIFVTHYAAIRTCSWKTCSKKKEKLQSLAELFTRRCLGADEHLLQAPISFMLIFNGIWIMGNFQLRKFVKINNKRSLFGGKLVFQFQDGDIICCFLGCLIWLKIEYFRNLVKWKHLTRWEPPAAGVSIGMQAIVYTCGGGILFQNEFPRLTTPTE